MLEFTRCHAAALAMAATVAAGLLAAPLPAFAQPAPTTCPLPSVEQGGQCVLTGDAVLNQTLRLPSFTKLNCKGYRLIAAAEGVVDFPRTTTNEFQPSRPELAILLHRSSGTIIQNCVIKGFDFGILLVETKGPFVDSAAARSGNKILANTIDVRTNAIGLIKADRTRIADNILTYASERGRGVVLEFDSDLNEIVDNVITSTDAASTGQVRQLPGGVYVTSTAIMDNKIHSLAGNRWLHNIVIGDQLIQVALADPQDPDSDATSRPDHNLIEGNTIVDLGVGPSCTLDPATACRANSDCGSDKGACLLKQTSGIGVNVRTSDTTVRRNTISGTMERGISFAGVGTNFTTLEPWYPGTCSALPSRLCVENVDCSIPDYDQADNGVCTGASFRTFNGNSVRLLAQENSLAGSFASAAIFANNIDDFSIRGNLVDGETTTLNGIRINGTAINGTVQHNVIANTRQALFLFGLPLGSNSVAFGLNDFTGYTLAVSTSNDYLRATDLGGNYWGLPCPGFDPDKVRFENGAVNPNVTDVYAYGVPIAQSSVPLAPCSLGQ